MKNTFTGLVPKFPNRGIHTLIGETLTFREQLMLRREFQSQSGWNDSLDHYMKGQLEELAVTVKRITYSPSGTDPAEVKKKRLVEARDTGKKLADAYSPTSINSDDLVMASSVVERGLSYDFTGQDPEIPQPTPETVPNSFARSFIAGLDNFVVSATNLDSRTQPATINAMESAQLQALLNELYCICMEKGGADNRMEIPTGVTASQRPGTFNADGASDPGESG